MARANTYEMEKGGFSWHKEGCIICGAKPVARGFYYPTFMNGDAEWLGDFCQEHTKVNLKKVMAGEIPLLYKIGE